MRLNEFLVKLLRSDTIAWVGVLGLASILTACASETPQPGAEQTTPAAAPAEHAGAHPRVFFVQPQDGATVRSPVHFQFGIENYQLSPVPTGTVETSRPMMGHHHLGVDTDCLPVGEVIPKAEPWIHFGTGNTEIDMQLAPGPHKFALQLGDDLHRTIEGLCTTISITVTPQ